MMPLRGRCVRIGSVPLDGKPRDRRTVNSVSNASLPVRPAGWVARPGVVSDRLHGDQQKCQRLRQRFALVVLPDEAVGSLVSLAHGQRQVRARIHKPRLARAPNAARADDAAPRQMRMVPLTRK